ETAHAAQAPAEPPGHSHDHDFAPWRYMVLMVPVVLFLLGLPNKLPTVRGHHLDLSGEATRQAASSAAAVLAGGQDALASATLAAALAGQRSLAHAKEIDFKTLEAAAYMPDERAYWRGKAITVRGQIPRNQADGRVFSLVRYKRSCCFADAIQL